MTEQEANTRNIVPEIIITPDDMKRYYESVKKLNPRVLEITAEELLAHKRQEVRQESQQTSQERQARIAQVADQIKIAGEDYIPWDFLFLEDPASAGTQTVRLNHHVDPNTQDVSTSFDVRLPNREMLHLPGTPSEWSTGTRGNLALQQMVAARIFDSSSTSQ
ncbi:MAG: hypothetical protein RI947_642 [Candidatus Parcubacteria bacterium]|jgi:hypothetical protein